VSEDLGRAQSPSNGRLDSWKEIATYLRRTVRTVQNWERNERLPVHRHRHGTRGTVYALPEEIDAWLAQRSEAPAQTPSPAPSRRRLAWLGAAGTIVLLAVASGLFLLGRRMSPASAGSVRSPRQNILVTAFENRTGEPLFDGTLEAALERELARSTHVSVVPRPRIEDALRLMRRPPETALDAAVGREVCIRDGGIPVLIAGRVEGSAELYRIDAVVIEAATGKVVAIFDEEASAVGAVAEAVRRLGRGLREALGEARERIRETEASLSKVTTPSLRALQLYSDADRIMLRGGGSAAAEPLLRQAVAMDPEFASAWIHLAWSIRNQRKPESEYLQAAARALELAAASSPVERLFIEGSYYSMSGDLERAIATYEELLLLQPDHFWAVNNITVHLRQLGDPNRASRYLVREAELRPQNLPGNFAAAQNLLRSGQLEKARPFVERGISILGVGIPGENPWIVAWMRLYPAWELWLQGNLEASEREYETLRASLAGMSGPERVAFAGSLIFAYRALGQTERARSLYSELPWEPIWKGIDAFNVNDREGVERYLLQPLPSDADPPSALLLGWERALYLARAGYVRPGRDLLAKASAEAAESPEATLVRAQLDLVDGHTNDGLRALDEVRAAEGVEPLTNFLAALMLGLELRTLGNPEASRVVLEEASAWRTRDHTVQEAWLAARGELMHTYRDLGRQADADQIEDELRRLLARADPDYWLLCELAHRPEECYAVARGGPLDAEPSANAGSLVSTAASSVSEATSNGGHGR